MSLLILIAKIGVVALFLVMFLRGNKLFWGIGLLAVTSAILLDTFLGTFGREEMLEELGFFFYFFSGAIFAGAVVWLWGLLRPIVATPQEASAQRRPSKTERHQNAARPRETEDPVGTTVDRKMLYEQIRYRLGPDDILDVIYDLGLNENDLFAVNQDGNQLAVSVIDLAEEQGKSSSLALAVERILTPIPSEHLPRLEKLSVDSPPSVLRHYLLAMYTLDELEQMARELNVDWENIAGDSKKARARNLLLHLQRRNRLAELIDLMQAPLTDSTR